MAESLSTQELIALGREMIQTVTESGHSLEVRTERIVNMAHAPIVHGLAQHSLLLGALVLDLHEDGKRIEAMPTVRALYEAALTAMWVSQSREAPLAFHNEDVRQRRALSDSFARSGVKAFQEGASRIAHLDADTIDTIANSQGRFFERRCTALKPGGAHAYSLYRAMSAYAHPSATLVDHYVEEHDNPAGVRLLQDPTPLDHDAWLFMSVASMMWAARAIDLMHRDSPHRNYLRNVARRLQVAELLDLTPEALAAEQRAAKERTRATWKGKRHRVRRGIDGAGLSPDA
jgi:hypothetical protein